MRVIARMARSYRTGTKAVGAAHGRDRALKNRAHGALLQNDLLLQRRDVDLRSMP